MLIQSRSILFPVIIALMSLLAFGSCSYAAENGLAAHYKFVSNFNDSSGNGNNGSIVGDVSLANDSVVGKCAVFNGGYISIPSRPALNLGGRFTISAWVLIDPVNNKGIKTIVSKLDNPGNYNIYHAYTRGNFAARLDAKFTKTGDGLVTGGGFDNYGMSSQWTHIVFLYDGDRLCMYVNGTMRGERQIKSDDSIKPSNGNMRIGTGNDLNNHGLFFMGKMADLRLYNRALSVEEIKALSNVGALANR